jgi:hypothetical protein
MPPSDPWGKNGPLLSQVLLTSFTLRPLPPLPPFNIINPIKPINPVPYPKDTKNTKNENFEKNIKNKNFEKNIKNENFEKLKTIFPNMEQKIHELVFEKHVTQNDIRFFIDHILDTDGKIVDSSKKPSYSDLKDLKDQAVAISISDESDSNSEDESVYRTYTRGDIENAEVVPYTVRSAQETGVMREKLREIFCQNRMEIDQALQDYPSKTDLNFFIEKLVQFLD